MEDPATTTPTPDAQAPHTARTIARRLGPAGLLGILWATAPALGGILLLTNIAFASEWLESHRAAAPFVYAAIFIATAGVGLLPTYAQAVLGGWVFGVWVGFFAAITGFTGAALVGYAIARFVSRDRVEKLIEENARARVVRAALIRRGFWRTLGIVALLRIPPNSPFALTNLVMSASGVRLLPYAIGTAIGMAPRTMVAVVFAAAAASNGAADIQEFVSKGPGIWVFVGGLVAMFVALGVIGHIANTALKKVLGPEHAILAHETKQN